MACYHPDKHSRRPVPSPRRDSSTALGHVLPRSAILHRYIANSPLILLFEFSTNSYKQDACS